MFILKKNVIFICRGRNQVSIANEETYRDKQRQTRTHSEKHGLTGLYRDQKRQTGTDRDRLGRTGASRDKKSI